MEKPLVSVIMAAKDTEPYLADCLDSIIAQTYTHWELIAVNDHSSDRTPQILQEYAGLDTRIKVYHSKKRKLIPALKEGYRHCTGTLINRMDSDDRMPPDKLEALVQEWLKCGRGTIIAGGTRHFVDEGKVGGGFIRYENWLNKIAKEGTYYEQIYQECVIPSHCWIIHKDDFDQAGAFEPEVYPEDYDLCFRFYKAGLRVVGIDKILHYWRDRPNRISRTWKEYEDNRYFDMKLSYFYQLDRDKNRPLVLWGGGKNGKDMAKMLLNYSGSFHWVCDNERKTGKDIYGITMQHCNIIPKLKNPQLMIIVASPEDRMHIKKQLAQWGEKKPVKDYWFFI